MIRKSILISILFLTLLAVPASAEFMTNFSFVSATADSDQGAAYIAWKAVDSTLTTSWQSNSGSSAWWQGDAGTSFSADNYNITPTAGFQAYAPVNWQLLGSTDSTTWSLLDVRTSQTGWTSTVNRTFIITQNKSSYRYYKFAITSSNYASMGMLYFYTTSAPSTPDTTPPNSITNLANTTTCENVTFTWTNPTNSDYSHLYNLWDNAVQGNLTNSTTTKAFTPAAGTHTFSTKTVDLSYNMNATWVNQSVVITACPTPTPTPTPSTTSTPVPPAAGEQWCGLQDVFFQHDGSDISGYENFINYPSGNPEVDENVTLTDSNWNLIDSYATPAGLPNVNLIQAGLRTYYLYAWASTSAGTTTLNVTLFKRNLAGIETKLYSVESGDIDAASVTLYTLPYASATNITLDSTDRLVAKVYAKKTTAGNVQFHWIYQGTEHASHQRSGFFVCPPSSCCVPTTTEVPAAGIPNLPVPAQKDGGIPWWAWVLLAGIVILVLWRVNR